MSTADSKHPKLTPEDIHHIAHLARIALSEDEEVRIAADLDRTWDLFDQLAQVNVDNVEVKPMQIMTQKSLRDDAVTQGDESAALASICSHYHADTGYISVPQVIEEE